MSVKLILFFSLLVEAISIFLYCKHLFACKRKTSTIVVAYILSYALQFFIHSFEGANGIIRNLCVFTLLNVILLLTLYDTSISSAAIHASIFTFTSILSEILTGSIWEVVFSNYWDNWEKDASILMMFLSLVLFSLFLFIISYVQRKISLADLTEKKEIVIAIIIAVLLTVIILSNFYCLLTEELMNTTLVSIVLSIILLAVIFFLNIYLFNCMRRNHFKNILIQKQHQFEQDETTLIKEIQQRDLEQRILLHDIKNHLLAINDMCGEETTVNTYISDLLSSSALSSPLRYCNNDFVNAMLYRYKQNAEENSIVLNIETSTVTLDFVSAYDITAILGNLLDNAFEACKKSDTPTVNLIITSDIDKKISIIKIINTYGDTIDINNLKTHKKDVARHGLGLQSVNSALRNYGGHLQQFIDNQEKLFTSIVIMNWSSQCE